jgi:phosphoribosylaminoimidazole-succinocarboxamide synthase
LVNIFVTGFVDLKFDFFDKISRETWYMSGAFDQPMIPERGNTFPRLPEIGVNVLTRFEPFNGIVTTRGELLAQGSSKDIYQVNDGEGTVVDTLLILKNGDRISVFDAGPRAVGTEIRFKGEVEALFTAAAFDHLHTHGISTHLIGTIDPESHIVHSGVPVSPTGDLLVERCAVPSITRIGGTKMYDTSDFKTRLIAGEKVVVPVEVIMRQMIIGGVSSVTENDLKWAQFVADNSDCELPEQRPTIGQIVTPSQPIIDFTTKYEAGDRTLSNSETTKYTGIEAVEIADFGKQATIAIMDYFEGLGLRIPDLKIEIGVQQDPDGTRSYSVIDVIGPDEMRIFVTDLMDQESETVPRDISKEGIRGYLRNSQWARVFGVYKKANFSGWKEEFIALNISAPQIAPEILSAQSRIYRAMGNLITTNAGVEKHYPDIGSLEIEIGRLAEVETKLRANGALITGDITTEQADEFIRNMDNKTA